MKTLTQSPLDQDFVQNPYPFYDRARAEGDFVFWDEYDKVAAVSHRAVQTLLKDRRFGREAPAELKSLGPAHLKAWLVTEENSLLEVEPPRHTRIRSLVVRAFTSRAITALEPFIHDLSHRLIDSFPDAPFDLLNAYCTQVPVKTICRLLGVLEDMSPDLLHWSHAMVAMYQAGRTRQTEDAAEAAAKDFTAFLDDYIRQRRSDPRDDLITRLIAAEEDGEKLTHDELIATCILVLNAGHEATVHSLGNGVKTVLQLGLDPTGYAPDKLVEEILRYDPPLHMFMRYAYEQAELFGHTFKRGDEVALLLGAANRDPSVWAEPDRFDPTRPIVTNASFGGGLHFCVGAPLARLEMRIALRILLDRCPDLRLTADPEYSNTYHFHGLTRLMVQA
ncbi:cytochrome P450 [Ruegeria arenilitoris]|uniref:cytochrome P450 n=1 Tax=Ruegeria arenilitoris TaxID=1173585 RepID=UPI00147AE5D1|nr:cytochrome P450 [Ruegeria arenilitoris]